MKFGFDLDGTLDRPQIVKLAHTLADAGHQLYIITGIFDEVGDWQGEAAKLRKLAKTGLAGRTAGIAFVHSDSRALAGEQATLAYRLRDMGLRKAAHCAEWDIDIFFDDSADYCAVMPKMCGTQIVQVH